MRELIPMDEYGVFADRNDTARVSSLMVAKYFDKSHNHVLRDIQNLDCSDAFRLSNFGQSLYINEQGKRQPCICMTRDGFMFLAMGVPREESGGNQRSVYQTLQRNGNVHPHVG